MSTMNCAAAAQAAQLTVDQLNHLVQVARHAAERGGAELMKHYGQLSSIENKGRSGDLVTNADLAAEKVVLEVLAQQTPDIAVLAEESGAEGAQDGLRWCVDPLDGTTNFAHGYPFFATSIGLTYQQQPVLGAIAVPFLRETYWGAPGLGAHCNEQPIQVSDCSRLEDSLLVTGFAYDRHEQLDNNYAEFCWFTHRTRGVRRGGAAAVDLAFVAAGRQDGYWGGGCPLGPGRRRRPGGAGWRTHQRLPGSAILPAGGSRGRRRVGASSAHRRGARPGATAFRSRFGAPEVTAMGS